MIFGREAECIVQRTYKELPFAFTEKDSHNLASGDCWHIVLSWRRHQQCCIEGTVSTWLLPYALIAASPFSPPPKPLWANCISHSGVFCNIYPSKSGFLYFPLPFSNSFLSQCPDEHLISKHLCSLGSELSFRLAAITLALGDMVLARTSLVWCQCCHQIKTIASEVSS